MEAKLKKKIKKQILKILPKEEIFSSKFQEIQSEIQQIKSEIERKPSLSRSETSRSSSEIQYSADGVSSEIYCGEYEPEDLYDIPNSAPSVSQTTELETASNAGESSKSSEEDNSPNDLSRDFHSMLEKGHFTDVSIKCGTDVLRAHKSVLCARSPVFEAMFTCPMQESKEDVVVIDDIEPAVFREMLTFMYSDQVGDLTLSTTCDLLYVAEKYQIKALKRICVKCLKSLLSEENAFHILQRANLYDEQLKTDTLIYISENFSAFQQTEEWRTVQASNPDLALEVYSKVVDVLQKKKDF